MDAFVAKANHVSCRVESERKYRYAQGIGFDPEPNQKRAVDITLAGFNISIFLHILIYSVVGKISVKLLEFSV